MMWIIFPFLTHHLFAISINSPVPVESKKDKECSEREARLKRVVKTEEERRRRKDEIQIWIMQDHRRKQSFLEEFTCPVSDDRPLPLLSIS
jgi:phosphoenolpyruvate synthase/pyruvate phosphate dikinase